MTYAAQAARKRKMKEVKNAEYYMSIALEEAQKAAAEDEVPVGAVIVKDGDVIARAHNRKEAASCAVRHAEIEAIELACKAVGNWWLENAEMYVTLEPCAMCAGALINSRIGKLYYGTEDPKYGCCGSLYNLPADERFNHRFPVTGGIMRDECSSVLSEYFKGKRQKR